MMIALKEKFQKVFKKEEPKPKVKRLWYGYRSLRDGYKWQYAKRVEPYWPAPTLGDKISPRDLWGECLADLKKTTSGALRKNPDTGNLVSGCTDCCDEEGCDNTLLTCLNGDSFTTILADVDAMWCANVPPPCLGRNIVTCDTGDDDGLSIAPKAGGAVNVNGSHTVSYPADGPCATTNCAGLDCCYGISLYSSITWEIVFGGSGDRIQPFQITWVFNNVGAGNNHLFNNFRVNPDPSTDVFCEFNFCTWEIFIRDVPFKTLDPCVQHSSEINPCDLSSNGQSFGCLGTVNAVIT